MRCTVLCCALMLSSGCSDVPQLAPPPPVPPAAPPGAAPADAQRQIEAQQLEQAEAKCATDGEHAVAQRTANGTLYVCAAPGENPPPPSKP
jgi:hypothetical protein